MRKNEDVEVQKGRELFTVAKNANYLGYCVKSVKRLQHLEVNIIYGLVIQLKYVFK